jgi:hypothetical protein
MQDMDEAFKLLVIIVSSVLSILVIVGIIAGIIVIRLLRDVRRITAKAEKVIASAESVGEVFRKVSGPVAISNVIRNIIKATKK